MSPTDFRLYTLPEAAEILGIKENTIRDWVWKKKIPVVRMGSRYVRVHSDDLRKFVETFRERQTIGHQPAKDGRS
jgi:excisionase family DNA binding protein